MSAIKFVLSLARKILARESKGITTIPNQMAVEQKAGEIAATLQSAGVPLNRADEFIKSEQDLVRILNLIESTPPVMKEVPSGIRSTKSAKVFNIKGDELDPNKPIIGGTQLGKRLDESTSKRLDERNTQLIKQRIADKKVETEAEIAERLNQENRKTVSKIKDRQRMVDDAIDNVSPGFSGDTKIDAELVAEDLAERMGLVYDDLPTKQRLDLYDQAYTGLSKQRFKNKPEDMAQGGRAGYKFGIGPLLRFFSENSPKQAAQKYLKSVKDRAMTDPKKLAPEMGAISATGIFVNRRMKDVLENMKNQDMENNLENFIKELDADPFYKEYPELKDKMIEGYTEMMFGEKKADGGRAGFKEGNKKITIDAAGSKSGKQQIMGAPEGITADRESIDAIIKADIPISEKIDLLAKYQYGKGRTRIERDGQEIFLDEGGFKSRDVGLGFNKEGEGIGGTLTYNLESGEPEFNIGFRKKFNEGGRIGLKNGMSRRKFMQIMGGLAAIPIVGKFFKAGKVATKAAPIVKTPPVPGKPKWFDALVNKVISEGDDVTKQLATKEREIVHTVKLTDEPKVGYVSAQNDQVTVYRDLDDGTVRVEYSSVDNMSEAPVNLTFKPGMADETTKVKPADTFQADEIVPESRMVGPDDFEIEEAVDEFDNVVDLNSDVSKLKEFAGEKLTTKEIVEGINKRKRSKAITEDRGEASDFMTSRQGDYDPSDYDDFASGGIARMLGE